MTSLSIAITILGLLAASLFSYKVLPVGDGGPATLMVMALVGFVALLFRK